jgi:hypothetical protein
MEAALEALERADEGFGAIDRPLEAAQTRISRMMALAMLGRFDEAVRCGSDARAVFDAANDAKKRCATTMKLECALLRRPRPSWK